jgi:DNA-binding HxlR family transcriptional regulator
LSDRLARLLDYEIVAQVPIAEGSKRFAYELTPKGKTLLPLLGKMQEWGVQWHP